MEDRGDVHGELVEAPSDDAESDDDGSELFPQLSAPTSRLQRTARSLKCLAPFTLLGVTISVGVFLLDRRTARTTAPLLQKGVDTKALIGLQSSLLPARDLGNTSDLNAGESSANASLGVDAGPAYGLTRAAGLEDYRKDEATVKRSAEEGSCVANLLSAVFQVADICITSVAAHEDCGEVRSGNFTPPYIIASSQDRRGNPRNRRGNLRSRRAGLRGEMTALSRVERLVREARESLESNTTSHLPGLKDLARSMRKISQVQEAVDEAKASLANGSAFGLPDDLLSPEDEAEEAEEAEEDDEAEEAEEAEEAARRAAPAGAPAAQRGAERAPEKQVVRPWLHNGGLHTSTFSSSSSSSSTGSSSSSSSRLSSILTDEETDDVAKISNPFYSDPLYSTEIDLYSPKREAQLRCARDLLYIGRSVGAASAKISIASGACPTQSHKPKYAQCSTQVTASISLLSMVGGDIDRMVLVCRPGSNWDMIPCANRLEALSWNIAASVRFLTGAVRACRGHNSGELRKGQIREYGWCIGEIFATMGFVASSGLNVYQGVKFDCERASELTQRASNQTPTVDDIRDIQIFRARCARDWSAFVRTLSLGVVKGVRSAAHCGDLRETCPRDILRSLSAFAGVAQAASQSYWKCNVPDGYNESESAKRIRVPDCVQENGGLVKMLGIAVAFLTDATGSCVGTKFAVTRCGGAVLRALAALGAMVEIWADTHRFCTVLENWFQCGRAQRFQGESMRVFTLATSNAALNCGLSPGHLAWTATRPVLMPRFFTFP